MPGKPSHLERGAYAPRLKVMGKGQWTIAVAVIAMAAVSTLGYRLWSENKRHSDLHEAVATLNKLLLAIGSTPESAAGAVLSEESSQLGRKLEFKDGSTATFGTKTRRVRTWHDGRRQTSYSVSFSPTKELIQKALRIAQMPPAPPPFTWTEVSFVRYYDPGLKFSPVAYVLPRAYGYPMVLEDGMDSFVTQITFDTSDGTPSNIAFGTSPDAIDSHEAALTSEEAGRRAKAWLELHRLRGLKPIEPQLGYHCVKETMDTPPVRHYRLTYFFRVPSRFGSLMVDAQTGQTTANGPLSPVPASRPKAGRSQRQAP